MPDRPKEPELHAVCRDEDGLAIITIPPETDDDPALGRPLLFEGRWNSDDPVVLGRAEDIEDAFDALYADAHSLAPAFLVIGAVRYALGRTSYAVYEVCDYLEENWQAIAPATRRVIQRDIRERRRREQTGNDARSFLGDACDRKRWLRILELPIMGIIDEPDTEMCGEDKNR